MKKMTLAQKCIFCILALAGSCLLGIAAKELTDTQKSAVTSKDFMLSHDSGFYDESFALEVTGDFVLAAYYTLDGTEPSRENPAAMEYLNGIFIECEDEENVYTVRIRAYFKDGTASDISERTFITGRMVKERYDVPVLCVSAPDDVFWGEEEGLLYKDHKYYMLGREYEREVFITLFDEQGDVVLSQDCGFGTHGKGSRVKNQVSFHLCARSEYSEKNKFEYTLFKNQYTEENALVSKYKKVIVRNSGHDNGFAFISSELATRLALDAGFPDAPCASPVAVYLNNTYNGFYWLVTHYNDTYYRETYGDYDGEMYTFEGELSGVVVEEDETDENVILLAEDYKNQMAFFSTCDLTKEENWAALNSFMDVENFLQYTAIQHYTCNTDSLNNNYKIYRYVAAANEAYRPDSVFDGRYRFLLFDMDHSFGYVENGNIWASVDQLLTTERVMSSDKNFLFFGNLLKRADCREYYIRYMLSLQNYYFSYEYAGNVLNEMHRSRENELRYTYATTDLLINNDCAPDVTSDEDIERALDDIRYFLRNRAEYTTQDLSGSFGPFTTYELSLENTANAMITLDYATINETRFSGLYYEQIPLTVSACAKPGDRFEYWIVNGEVYSEASFTIDESMLTGDGISLECICSPDPDAEIYVTAIKSNTGNDYVEITNLGSKTQYLNNYYLTDDEQWNKSSLPGLALKSGETITVYCKNYTGLEALGEPAVNFNLKAGETLSLYRKGELRLQAITVPDMGSENGVYAMDIATGKFREIIP